jgi:hypothetical protein
MSARRRRHTILSILLEVVLISVGVFLAMWASNWRENREHRALADSALRNFAEEMRANQKMMQADRQYHETLARELEAFINSKEPATSERFDRSVHFFGVHPIIFEHTAWDLALATQALAYLKPDLAFLISKVYTEQNAFQLLELSYLSSVYNPASFAEDNVKGQATAMKVYLGDVNTQEPAILARYQKVLPEVTRALGDR